MKAPWHSPSECSFDYGYRVGVLTGRVLGLRAAVKIAGSFTREPDQKMLLKKAVAKLAAWKKGRPKDDNPS